jgi:hypothetical protein
VKRTVLAYKLGFQPQLPPSELCNLGYFISLDFSFLICRKEVILIILNRIIVRVKEDIECKALNIVLA